MPWTLSLLAALVVCLIAAITDTRTGLIPNWLTFPVIVGAPLVCLLLSGPGALLPSLLGLLLCGGCPYLMFRAGGMGGGDVKLFAGLGALLGVGLGLQVQLVSMLLASLWAVGVLLYRGELWGTCVRASRLLLGRLLRTRTPMPTASSLELRLGAPIALAMLAVSMQHLLEHASW